jgi:pilus assembly protein CpaB
MGLAVLCGLAALRPPAARTTPVLVAARDLAAGETLGPDDLTTVELQVAVAPQGALRDAGAAAGRTLAAAVRRGEPLTDVRLLGPELLAGASGLVEAPVRVADGDEARLVRPGDVIDVLSAPGADSLSSPGYPDTTEGLFASAKYVAVGARVLAVPTPAEAGTAADGALVVLAVSTETARDLAAAAASQRLSLVVEADRTAG